MDLTYIGCGDMNWTELTRVRV